MIRNLYQEAFGLTCKEALFAKRTILYFKDKSGYPEYIHIPAGGTTLLTLPNGTAKAVRYIVENTITAVNEKLIVDLF
ncbi:MAG: hypothetical protein LBV32_02655 [Tannerellaceae bacterium]|jgi:hypothetical protein|nr:hypothetical protein [Tannerellaceae bacterium]